MTSAYHASPLDNIIPPLYFSYILTFESKEIGFTNQLSQHLESAWFRLLGHHPILQNSIERDVKSGGFTFAISTDTIASSFVKADLRGFESPWIYSYQELKAAGMPSEQLDATILAPLSAGVGYTKRVISAQLNVIPGGILFAVCFSHAFVDARGAAAIVGLLAEQCREMSNDIETTQSTKTINAVGLRAKSSVADYDTIKSRQELWQLLGLAWEPSDEPRHRIQMPLVIPAATSHPKSGTTSKIFSLSPESLKELKRVATPTELGSPQPWISTNDALVAFLWRHIMLARFPPTAEVSNSAVPHIALDSIVTVAIEGRKAFGLPNTYIGNVIFCGMTKMPLKSVVASTTSLQELSLAVRQTVSSQKTESLLNDALSLAACLPPDVAGSLQYAFDDFMGKDLVTTSWVDLPFYDMIWGARNDREVRIDFFRMPKDQFEGICCIMPRCSNGSIEVMIGMKDDAMGRLLADQAFLEFTTSMNDIEHQAIKDD